MNKIFNFKPVRIKNSEHSPIFQIGSFKNHRFIKMNKTLRFIKMNNKKAYSSFDDMIVLFACFAIIGAGIVLGVWMFYSATIDIRLEESKVMNNRLMNAVVENNHFNNEVMREDFNIFREAGIDEKTFSSGNYYFSLKILEGDNKIKSFTNGTRDFEVQCYLPGEQMAKCYEKELRVMDRDRQYKIKILTGSNQLGSRL